ncbi:hypothetical protein ACFXD5_19530 [Streptomyces sp. NPDC059385]|uniref:hypothetical protein n=1 Tax=Streptomyces sp. NPDC059385 TaxID=3346817 RepID=UPI00368ECFCA
MSHHEPIAATTIRAATTRLQSPPTKTYSNGIDWIAVERAARGELPAGALTPAEAREAAVWLVRAGVARKAISVQLSVYERLVKEWAAEEGLLPDADLCSRAGCRRATAGRGLCALCLSQQRILERKQKAALAVAA